MLEKEQVERIKRQIFDHIDSSFPEDKKDQAKAQLEAMNEEELEDFLKKNNLIKEGGSECIFCSIAEGNIPSFKIAENQKAVAVLEINPVSNGHALVLPKNHSGEVPREANTLAEEVAKKISSSLKPKRVDLAESEMFGHKIINVIPVYGEENLHSKREKAEESFLADIQKKISLGEKKEPAVDPRVDVPEVITEKDMILPRRIP